MNLYSILNTVEWCKALKLKIDRRLSIILIARKGQHIEICALTSGCSGKKLSNKTHDGNDCTIAIEPWRRNRNHKIFDNADRLAVDGWRRNSLDWICGRWSLPFRCKLEKWKWESTGGRLHGEVSSIARRCVSFWSNWPEGRSGGDSILPLSMPGWCRPPLRRLQWRVDGNPIERLRGTLFLVQSIPQVVGSRWLRRGGGESRAENYEPADESGRRKSDRR